MAASNIETRNVDSPAEKQSAKSRTESVHSGTSSDDDDKVLEQIGYVPSFKREFSNLATVRCRVFEGFDHC